MDGSTPIDVYEPQFTQREAAEISGADISTINNWIERDFILLKPSPDRRGIGRRFFNVEDIAYLALMYRCTVKLGLAPSVAHEICIPIFGFYELDHGRMPVLEDGSHLELWNVCETMVRPARKLSDGRVFREQRVWKNRNVYRHPVSGLYFDSRLNPFQGFPKGPYIMLPISQTYYSIFLECCGLLGLDFGVAPGTFTQGLYLDPESDLYEDDGSE